LSLTPLSKQDTYKWAVDSTCNFRNGAYFVKYSTRSNGTYTCDTEKISMRDGAIAMDVTLFSGNSADIIFRASHGMDNFYEFMVSQQQFVLGAFINNNATLITPPHPVVLFIARARRTICSSSYREVISSSLSTVPL
jgi:hypothetical protein